MLSHCTSLKTVSQGGYRGREPSRSADCSTGCRDALGFHLWCSPFYESDYFPLLLKPRKGIAGKHWEAGVRVSLMLHPRLRLHSKGCTVALACS
jgi:hypothetical protein